MKNIRGYIEHIRESESADQLGKELIEAIKQEKFDRCKELIGLGANVNVLDSIKWSPLHWAALRSNTDIVKLLIDAGADLEAEDFNNMTPLAWVVNKHETAAAAVVKLLIDAGADLTKTYESDGNTVLHWAAESGLVDIAKLLIDAGADPDAENKHAATPLHHAAGLHKVDIVKLLIDAGANLDKIGSRQKQTALHMATYEEDIDIVKLLIDAGAEVNITNHDSFTPLEILFNQFNYPEHFRDNVNFKLVKLLIQAGAKINLKTYFNTFKEFNDSFSGDIKWIPLNLIPPEWRDTAKFTGTFGGFY
jgi:ankyrin repeat protein